MKGENDDGRSKVCEELMNYDEGKRRGKRNRMMVNTRGMRKEERKTTYIQRI